MCTPCLNYYSPRVSHLKEAAGVLLLCGIAVGVQPHHSCASLTQRAQRVLHKLSACTHLSQCDDQHCTTVACSTFTARTQAVQHASPMPTLMSASTLTDLLVQIGKGASGYRCRSAWAVQMYRRSVTALWVGDLSAS